MHKSPLNYLLAAALSSIPLTTFAQGAPMDKTTLITRQPFDVRIIANGRDVTANTPVVAVKYNADGTGSRTLRDGRTVAGTWRFLNPSQTQIEVNGPDGTTRWVITELGENLYRKANLDTGVEFIHVPKAQ
jgi:hypothetical protein